MKNIKDINAVGVSSTNTGIILAMFGGLFWYLTHYFYIESLDSWDKIYILHADTWKPLISYSKLAVFIGIIFIIIGSVLKNTEHESEDTNNSNTNLDTDAISKKLQSLEQLKSNGLISEEEYNTKRKEIIDSSLE